MLTAQHEIIPDSGGPGKHRGGCGVRKGGTLTQVDAAVMSYCCDRARSVTWGIKGGLPSVPHGVWLNRGDDDERFLGANFSGVPVKEGDRFERPSAGGGGLGDPLERDPDEVLEDVADGYVTIKRAALDYGVVVEEVDVELAEYKVDADGHREAARRAARGTRAARIDEDPEDVARALPRRRAGSARPRAPLRRDPRLGQRRGAPAHHRAVPGAAAPPQRQRMGLNAAVK